MRREFTVVAIHGEGDRATVNALQQHRNNVEVQRLRQYGMPIPPALESDPDEAPDVIVVLRDVHHQYRIEWPVDTWEEVDHWQKLAGYDSKTRHWKHGATVKVAISGK